MRGAAICIFLSPVNFRPLDRGFDLVVHSGTKYLNGHSDVVGGAIISKTQEHADKVAHIVNALGLACSPFDAWLVLRGVKSRVRTSLACIRGNSGRGRSPSVAPSTVYPPEGR